MAVNSKRLSTLLASVITLRLIITAAVFILFATAVTILDPSNLRTSIILIAALATLPQGIAVTLDSIFVALRKLPLSALGLLLLSIFTSLVGFSLVYLSFGLIGATIALLFGQILYVLILVLIFLKLKITIKFLVSLRVLREIMGGALPYGLLGILGILYFKIDSLLLVYIRGPFETGIYGAAYKFLEAVIFIPSALSSALFPLLSKLSATTPTKVYGLYLRATKLFLAVSLIVVFVYLVFLPVLITQFLPQYLSSIEVVRILTLTIPFFFMITPQAAILLSHKAHLKKVIVLSVFNLTLNVILNLIFIPRYGYFGAAWVTLISDIIGFIIFFIFIKRYYGAIR